MRAFNWLASAILVGVMASAAFAARGVVITNSGQTFEGEVTEDVNSVVVVRQGVQIRIPRAEIQSLRFVAAPEEEIRKEWSRLVADDAAGRASLARRAFQIREYQLCRELAEEAIRIDPNNLAAHDMLELVRRQMAMEQRSSETAQSQRAKPTIGRLAGPGMELPIEFLSERDMNALRQAELQAGDERFVRVRFNNDVRRRFAVQPHVDAAAFAEMTAFQQALTIIREGDRQMRDDVIISGDPIAIRSFRTVQKNILNGCATAQCHGSAAGGNFMLYPLQETEQVTYTNFYLLMKYARINREQPEGIFGGGGARLRMVDRQRPGTSLLLQYGLPPNMAEMPHPQVPGFRAMFSGYNDPVAGRVLAWIRDGLRPVDIVYDLEYLSPIEKLSRPEDVVDTRPTTAPQRPETPPATEPAASAPATRPATTTRPVPGSIPVPPRPGEAAAEQRPVIPMPQ